ncbi:lipoprotein-releasing system transmembrane protein [Candidatus Photodesmus katoptron]|uniref:FtsX-like permease family protein n=1 Tax=Candidatus Photodesmus anomalopis TaxID=28176 RepID=UPI0004D762D6|nr:FtsX-like permease family protein [Candidatus Photodesmus katoptron]KEY90472.1 lipoprotein-releasing system transmembrane protein [Candidatus Photodesmus katoptron]
MFYPISIFISFRHLKEAGGKFSQFTTYMSVIGITVGVMALVMVLSIMSGFETNLKNRVLGVLPQAVISYKEDQTSMLDIAPKFITAISNRVEPLIHSEVIIQSISQLSSGYIIGVDPNSYDPIEEHLIIGDDLASLQSGSYRLFLGDILARSLNVFLGDKVRLTVTSVGKYTPFGLIPAHRNFTVAGIFSTGSDVDEQLIVTNIADAGRLLQYEAENISGWRLFFTDPFVVADLSSKPLPKGWKWNDWRDQRGELFQAVRMERNIMSLMLSLIILVASFNVISVLIIVLMEKQTEVAILKTQGMIGSQIFTIFIIRGMSIGFIGSIIGSLLGIFFLSNLKFILRNIDIEFFLILRQLPIIIDLKQIVIIILLTIALSMFVAIFPSYRASFIKPIEVLRHV